MPSPAAWPRSFKGDQVRARGQRSEDALKVTAEELVFGTFATAAGTITAVNPVAHEIALTDVTTKKPVTVRLAADTMLKGMPDFRQAAPHAGGGPQPFSGPGGMARMLDQMPAAQLEDLKVGGAVTVTSTKGAQNGRVTAILVVDHAEPMVQMIQQVQAMAGMGAAAGAHGVDAMHAGILSAEGLNFPGMIQ